MARTLRKKETRPSRQARGRAHKSNHMVAQNKAIVEGAMLTGFVLFAVVAVPYLLYAYVAPMQGWM